MSAPHRDNKAPVKAAVRRPIKRLFSTAWSAPITPPPVAGGDGFLSPSEGGYFYSPAGQKYIQP